MWKIELVDEVTINLPVHAPEGYIIKILTQDIRMSVDFPKNPKEMDRYHYYNENEGDFIDYIFYQGDWVIVSRGWADKPLYPTMKGAEEDSEGLCPQCGEKGEFIGLAPVCSIHGPYEFKKE